MDLDVRFPMTRRDEILSEISLEQKRLNRLRSELEQSGNRLKALRGELGETPEYTTTIELSTTPLDPTSTSLSNSEKIKIFRSLFRGREEGSPNL